MTINFCFDHVLDSSTGLVLPNLCGLSSGTTVEQFQSLRHDLSLNFPYCDYPRLLEYAQDEGVKFTISTVEQAPPNSFYMVNINFFVPDFDYFAMLSQTVLKGLRESKLRILFFYCEADTPDRLSLHFESLCARYGIPVTQFYFISHNTRAQDFERWFYFNDDELLYHRTCHQFLMPGVSWWHNYERPKKTTALVRTHKNWRAVFCGQLYKMNFSDHSWFSYCANDNKDDQDLFDCAFKPELNKLRHVVDPNNTWLKDAQDFLQKIPITVDDLDNNIRNQYQTFIPDFFRESYWNIVIETHIDVENLPGVFLTEKTWKPIAHYQPFVIMGCAGSLEHLRQLGYQTFGDYIDESYDTETDHIRRAYKVLELCDWLCKRSHQQLQDLNQQLRPIVTHNRELFWRSKKSRIQTLFDSLAQNG